MFGNKMGHVEKAIKKNNAGTLVGLCSSKDREVCLAAVAGLGSVGGQEAVNELISQLQSNDQDMQIAAAHSLGVIGDKHSKAFLSAQMNKETDPKVRDAMGEAMKHIKSY